MASDSTLLRCRYVYDVDTISRCPPRPLENHAALWREVPQSTGGL